MTLTIIEHQVQKPALYGAMASVLALARRADLVHLRPSFDTRIYADAIQHVVADGALVASGLVWLERLGGVNVTPEMTVDEILQQGLSRDVVVPYHPSAFPIGEVLAHLVAGAADLGIRVEHCKVVSEGGLLRVAGCGGTVPSDCITGWSRDYFGRLAPGRKTNAVSLADSTPLRVAFAGAEKDHRDVYPAALAALGDAAEAQGVSVDVSFVPPRKLCEHDVADVLAGTDGVLLPGGSDMANVPGQILMAHGALRLQTPIVGLCLGMQTMTTAVVQSVLGSSEANLAEADPDTSLKTFVPLSETGRMPPHRLGERTISVAPVSRLGDLIGCETRIRCNHRYRLNLDLVPTLERAGLRVTAWDGTGQIADAIELDSHPFYIGMQGHPELSSRAGKPHPVLEAFLQACLAHQSHGGRREHVHVKRPRSADPTSCT